MHVTGAISCDFMLMCLLAFVCVIDADWSSGMTVYACFSLWGDVNYCSLCFDNSTVFCFAKLSIAMSDVVDYFEVRVDSYGNLHAIVN